MAIIPIFLIQLEANMWKKMHLDRITHKLKKSHLLKTHKSPPCDVLVDLHPHGERIKEHNVEEYQGLSTHGLFTPGDNSLKEDHLEEDQLFPTHALSPDAANLRSQEGYQAFPTHDSHSDVVQSKSPHLKDNQASPTHDPDPHVTNSREYHVKDHRASPIHSSYSHGEDSKGHHHLEDHKSSPAYIFHSHGEDSKVDHHLAKDQAWAKDDFLTRGEEWKVDHLQGYYHSPTHDSHPHEENIGSKSPIMLMCDRYNKEKYKFASQRDKHFWHMYGRYIHNHNEHHHKGHHHKGHHHKGKHHQEDYKTLLHDMNDFLLSGKETWQDNLVGLFEETRGNEVKQVLLFWFLGNLINFYKVPIVTTQVIQEYLAILSIPVDHWEEVHNPERWHKLDLYNWWTGRSPGRFSRVVSIYWDDHLERTRNAYAAKMVTQIQSLEPERDLPEFVDMQKGFPLTGVVLAGDWSAQDQKDLLSFWMSKRILYSKVFNDPALKKVLEAQFIQTEIIKRLLKSRKDNPTDKTVPMDEQETALKLYSKTILEYIQAIDSQKTLKAFFSTQSYINPYGMVLPLDAVGQDRIKIIYFWTKYVVVFTKMLKFSETPNLQITIGDLVKKDFRRMSAIMDDFLHLFDGYVFDKEYPVLDQYLDHAGDPLLQNWIKPAFRAVQRFRTIDRIRGGYPHAQRFDE